MTCTWYEIDPGHVQHFWNGWVEGDRIEFSGSRFAAPDFGIEPDAAARRARRPSNEPGTAGPLLGRPRSRHGRVGSSSTTSAATSTGSTTTTTACGAAMATCRPSAATSADRRRLRHHRQVRRQRPATRTSGLGRTDGHVGESVFAPDPAGTAEDDGWLVNAVYDDDTRRQRRGGARRPRHRGRTRSPRCSMPRRMPFGFHANWFAAS